MSNQWFGIDDQRGIDVQWGNNSCKVSYQLPTLNKELAYERRAAMCVGAGTVVGAQ
ncbi:hypothetical protein [Burkholderia ambifaria]|jgi:outer membrane usher protein|uniref:hypothetical protein n=1 Tax=Burkholderia ambifaria TaxID=152480 RepID=UPI003C7B730B